MPGGRNSRRVAGWAFCLLVSSVSVAWAQNKGGGSSFGGGGGSGDPGSRDTGTEKAEIISYRPAKAEQDDLTGTLMIKTESGKTLRLDIRSKDALNLNLGNHNVTPEEYERVFLPGLNITAGWATNKSSARKQMLLNSVSFDTIIVTGRVRGVADDGQDQFSIIGKPDNDADWPAFKKPPPKPRDPKPPKAGSGGGSGRGSKPPKAPPPPRPKVVANKALRLRYLEGVSTLTDSGSSALAVADLREYKDSEINATIVFGKRICLVVSAQIQGERQSSDDDATASGGGSGDGR